MDKITAGAKQCAHTMFHPVSGFDQIKWEKKGSPAFCLLILLAFFLTNVFDQVLTGFIFNTYNPDRISVPSIFLTSIGGFAICYAANWAVSSLMFTEGDERNIFICLCYTLVPYTVSELIYIFATNFANNEVLAFLTAIRIIGLAWSGVILVVGMFYVHQLSFGKTILNLALSVVGILVILFLILLAYSLVQQIYTFVFTIYNEIVFRI
ncbi:MAG: Yip1 family protein [Faecousia sp.]